MYYPAFCVFILYLLGFSSSSLNEDVARIFWDGVGFFVPVSKQAVQKKLDEWHRTNSDVCEAPRLFLPNYRVFPEAIEEDQHPIYIDWGNVTFLDFKDSLDDKENPAVFGIEVSVNIPLLTVDPNGPPAYSLALGTFYQRERRDFPKSNIHYPYIPADQLVVDDYGAFIQIGNEAMNVSFERFRHPCQPPLDIIAHEFDSFVEEDLHLGTPEPNFDYCYHHPTDNHFCQTAERLRCTVSRLAPNLCQMWHSVDMIQCATSVEVVRATYYFRDFLLLGDSDPINIVSSVTAYGNSTVGLKYPCID